MDLHERVYGADFLKILKAQIVAEFLFVLSILALISLIIYVIYGGQRINVAQIDDNLKSARNAYALSAAINYVHLAGEGAQYNFTLSGKDDNEVMTISNFTVQSNRTNSISQAPLLNRNINTSEVHGGEMIIKNNNGEIEIEQ